MTILGRNLAIVDLSLAKNSQNAQRIRKHGAARHLSFCETAWWIAFGNGTTHSPRRTTYPAAISTTDSGECEASP